MYVRVRYLAPLLLAVSLLVSTPAAAGYRYTHEVLPGETLHAIAKHYHVKPRKLRRLNRLRGRHLRVGRKLKIVTRRPARPIHKTRHTVRRGDTLRSIARRYKMKVSLLRRLNRGVRPARLRPGRKLWVVVKGPRPQSRRRMYQLYDGPGYVVRNGSRAWGSFLTINRLMEVLADYAREHPDAPLVRVDDISRRRGGYLAPHRSHRTGRDVDIRYPLKNDTDRYVKARSGTIHVARTWELIERFLETRDVVYIFIDRRLQRVLYRYAKRHRGYSKARLRELFQFPRSSRAMVGIIRHEPGHRTHFHVRFRKEKSRQSPTS
jgi:LysM repeat protein